MNFKEMMQSKVASYTAIVLNPESRQKLLLAVVPPSGYERLAHHMTINMGAAAQGPAAHLIGQPVRLLARRYAVDEKVMAVGVDTDVPSLNQIKHITVAVNRAVGGKPFHSNGLTNWQSLDVPIELHGTIAEVAANGHVLERRSDDRGAGGHEI